ncbi:DUF2163 domain-containing protein [uncultured Paracoccus sp.]|uniref:DUF2163 domain-containing protein n=1 Tax=uncultured Paracoccus sp. TaxID=189685 RepID=UPI002606EFA9|nr:DUF2163 domain-containing protein [uncultured Paracoccus sp.]
MSAGAGECPHEGGITTTEARAWAVTRRDGLTLGFTDHDAVLRFDGITYRPEAGLTARAVVQGLGLAVDNTEAQGMLSDDAITEADLRAGRWDRAEVRLWQLNWADPLRRQLLFRGELGEVSRADGAFRAELRGMSEALNVPLGRVYHRRCAARLGDQQCRADLSRPGCRIDAVVHDGGEGLRLDLSAAAEQEPGWFEDGVLTVLDGVAHGLRGAIKRDRQVGVLRRIELWADLGLVPAAGDRVRLTAGCDKRPETCRTKFENYLNFRGFPHLPPEDWLIAPKQVGRR